MKTIIHIITALAILVSVQACQIHYDFPNNACGHTFVGHDENLGQCMTYIGPNGFMTFDSDITGHIECRYFTPEKDRMTIGKTLMSENIPIELIEAFAQNNEIIVNWRIIDPCADVSSIRMKKQIDILSNPSIAMTSDLNNTVTSFFYYMWNGWCEQECRETFGMLHEHFWAKWKSLSRQDSRGAAEKFFSELSDDNRKKLVERAVAKYDGRAARKTLPQKQKYEICYIETVHNTITLEASSEDEVLDMAEEAWCDYDSHPWEETRKVLNVQSNLIS